MIHKLGDRVVELSQNLPKKVLLLGSGALQIGQAGEFDYSGSQALKALREEGISTVLINPNIATVQTNEGMADQVYFLPVQPYFVEEVLRKEKCDSILLSFGGQTALNCGLELEASGVLSRLGVRVLGTPVSTIRDTEDRHLFVLKLKEIQVDTARSRAVISVDEALQAAQEIGYPVMLRSGFSLGGKGSSIVQNATACREVVETAFASVPQILVEECLWGWKEIEYEVVRDSVDNCITVCNMENVDPMGIHTGESIVVAPSQTLDDFEYQMLRDIALKTIRHLGIVGECNIQYALNPKTRDYRVIEVNARLSRSSALASKATGYPLAYVAAKISLGYELPDIPNAITKVTTAFFEPALDYIVCKVPRWDLSKFEGADQKIGSEMKSVGEVMAIGRSFPEALQKALRMVEIGAKGLDPDRYVFKDLLKELREPTPRRIFAVAQAFRTGMSCAEIAALTGIDAFFLTEMKRIVDLHCTLQTSCGKNLEGLDAEFLLELKKAGFSDSKIAHLLGKEEKEIRHYRQKLNIRPKLTQIDTLAAEYPAETNFLYFSYSRSVHDIQKSNKKALLVLGSGCYRIGSSVEFDWCAVSAVQTARELGYETLLINCNPETVSTDYDICDRLVFDEISVETILELYEFEQPEGVIVSMGGQTPNNLVLKLQQAGIKIIGTAPQAIDMAEDRKKFSLLLDSLNIAQPKWEEACDLGQVSAVVNRLGGYPILIRPSYVLSGSAMRVAYHDADLIAFLKSATEASQEHPVVLTKFETFSREVEFDAVADHGHVVLWALSEHIENAGVHSGDATLVIPPQRISSDVMKKMREIGVTLARQLKITGPFNVQMLSKNHEVKVIELNLRASRSFPFVSKSLGVNFIREATKIMLNNKSEIPHLSFFDLNYVAVKSPHFSFSRIKGADPKSGVEMASTGEVACFGADTEEALLKAMLASGFRRPKRGVFIAVEPTETEYSLTSEAQLLRSVGLKIYTWEDRCTEYQKLDIPVIAVHEMSSFMSLLKCGEIDWVVSIPGHSIKKEHTRGYQVRRSASDWSVSLTTDPWVVRRLTGALIKYNTEDLMIAPWSFYLNAEKLSENVSKIERHESLDLLEREPREILYH
jgi:carbamoyl-phosphate synthase large subunit